MELDIQQIMTRLPHRYPMLLVDRVIEMVPGKSIVAIKNVSMNEPHFTGHFPGRPVMPGVTIVEAMAQTPDLDQAYSLKVDADILANLSDLMVNAGRVLSKSQILDHVWEYDWGGDGAIVESYISYLRRKIDSAAALGLDKDALAPLIHTRRGVGYVLRRPREN